MLLCRLLFWVGPQAVQIDDFVVCRNYEGAYSLRTLCEIPPQLVQQLWVDCFGGFYFLMC